MATSMLVDQKATSAPLNVATTSTAASAATGVNTASQNTFPLKKFLLVEINLVGQDNSSFLQSCIEAKDPKDAWKEAWYKEWQDGKPVYFTRIVTLDKCRFSHTAFSQLRI